MPFTLFVVSANLIVMKLLVLDNIRSHYNVGALFRTADGAGVSKIYLTGITPAPIDRFGRKVAEIGKTALGAEEVIPYENNSSLLDLVRVLKIEGYTVVAIEQDEKSVPIKDFKEPDRVAYILGSETEGLAPAVLQEVDFIIELPMLGQKESLNVSVAGSIVLYRGLIG